MYRSRWLIIINVKHLVQDEEQDPLDTVLWGALESESESESEEEKEEDKADETGIITPAEGYVS